MDRSNDTNVEKGPNLEKVAYNLTYNLLNMFLKNQDWHMYHPNMVLEDNIRGRRHVGLETYMRLFNLVKLTGHIRFVYVRFHILKLTQHPENGTIRIRWRIAGLGMLRMLLRYFPDKMWMKGHMDRAAPSWYDGISTFHVGTDDRIYKHVLDRVDRDQEQEVETLTDRLKKLNPVAAPVSPAM